MDLKGKIAVVTGGTGGIGAASAYRLAAQGAHVVVGYHKRLDVALELISKLAGGPHRAVRVAMEDSASIASLVEEVASAYGRADILVNSAGFTRAIPHNDLAALDDETFDAMFVAHVRGPFVTTRAFVPLLRASGNGVVVNVSSTAAKRGTGSNMAYAASKAALDSITVSLARVLGPEIRVIGVSPAAVDTSFVPDRDRSALERIALASPLRRIVEPDDVARSIIAAITHLRLTTGSTIIVDGGQSL